MFLCCQHMHFRNLLDLGVVFFLVSFTVHNPHAVSCFGHRGNLKKAIENYSSNYLGNEFIVYFKVVTIFKAKLSNSACGINEMMSKLHLCQYEEGWVRKCIASFSSWSLSSFPSCFSWEHCLINHFNTNIFPRSVSGEHNLRQMVWMILNSRAYMLKNLIIENKRLKYVNIHPLALKG